MLAAAAGNIPAARLLLWRGADPNARREPDAAAAGSAATAGAGAVAANEVTVLQHACSGGGSDLAAAASVVGGLAAAAGVIDRMCRLLLAHGAEAEPVALRLAASAGAQQAVGLLLAAGAAGAGAAGRDGAKMLLDSQEWVELSDRVARVRRSPPRPPPSARPPPATRWAATMP